MEFYTLGRNFLRKETIDRYYSAIWTERYLGDDDFELVVPATSEIISKLPADEIILCEDSDIPMIIETREIKDKVFTVKGISLTKWLNNRPFRAGPVHNVKDMIPFTWPAGQLIWFIVRDWLTDGEWYDTNRYGLGEGSLAALDGPRMLIPGLVMGDYDDSDVTVATSISFGGFFDAIFSIATTYDVGMKIKLDYATEEDYQISFHTYKGVDRTSSQSDNDVIQFSPEMDSLSNITELEDVSRRGDIVYSWASNMNPEDTPYSLWLQPPGRFSSVADSATGFDLRIKQGFADDVGVKDISVETFNALMNQKAETFSKKEFARAKLVDGEIIQRDGLQFGEDFFLGDIIEIKGYTGTVNSGRITEYIRSQNSAGYREFPTLTMID